MSDSPLRQYKVFGLVIQSEIELAELIEHSDSSQCDILLRKGKVSRPEEDMPATIYRPKIVFNPKLFFLNLENKARFRVTHKDIPTIITIEILDASEMNTILSWFYGSVLTAAMQMNNRFAFHASAVNVGGRLHLFCGPSGIGKSTLAAHLHSRGYHAFTDDKCVLLWDETLKEYMAESSIQIMRLWEDATNELDNDAFLENPSPVVNRINKYQYLIKKQNIIKERVPVEIIYIIQNVSEDQKLEIVIPKGMTKITLLQNQIHRKNYINGLGKTESHWKFMDHLISQIPVILLLRPKNTSIVMFVDFVERHLKGYPVQNIAGNGF